MYDGASSRGVESVCRPMVCRFYMANIYYFSVVSRCVWEWMEVGGER